MRIPFLRRLRAADEGVSAVEFGLAAPFLLLIIMGTFELGQMFYIRTVLHGAMNAASRNTSLESSQAGYAQLDDALAKTIRSIAPNADVQFLRRNYEDFGDVGRPENFTDTNHNGTYDPNECFEDENGNKTWDADVGKTGLGGANDVVLYTVTVSYNHLFGYGQYIGLPLKQSMSASTFLRNQPYATQATRTTTQVCPS